MENDKLPATIIGALPSAKTVKASIEHRVIGQTQDPDGNTRQCSCGFSTRRHGNEDALELEWFEHM